MKQFKNIIYGIWERFYYSVYKVAKIPILGSFIDEPLICCHERIGYFVMGVISIAVLLGLIVLDISMTIYVLIAPFIFNSMIGKVVQKSIELKYGKRRRNALFKRFDNKPKLYRYTIITLSLLVCLFVVCLNFYYIISKVIISSIQ